MKTPEQIPNHEERARLAAALAFLRGATLQKLWLPSPLQLVLQLRAPGRTLLLLVDARRGIALELPERPAAPDQALPAQAALRKALAGARVDGVGLAQLAEAPARPALLTISFSTPRGSRTLLAEPAPRPLLSLLAGDRIAWVSSEKSAGPLAPDRKTGAPSPELTATALPDAPPDGALTAPQILATDEGASLQSRKTALLKTLRARLKKLEKAAAAVDGDLLRAQRADGERRRAELLLPHQSRIARGAREALVPDWSRLDAEGRPAQVAVELDPALDAAGNAARWLKRAHRYRAALPRIAERRAELDRAAAALRALHARVEAAGDKAALRAAEEDARALTGDAPEQRKPGRKARPAEKVPFRAFRSKSGARVLVGRNARANDELTLKWARGNDLWLHARGVQGSHVIVPEPGDAPDGRTLADAALLAAHFSSARGSDGAEVAWTRRKHVRKAKGAAPGAVTYSQEKTMRVRLDGDRLRELLATEGR